MPEFDPYHRWLSISPEEQPPNHYRLLGIKPFEIDSDAIESAADRQMAHVRSFQTGKHAAWSQKLLNELSAAKVCLLAPAQKAAYDRDLRARLTVAAPPVPTAMATKPEAATAKPLPTAKSLSTKRDVGVKLNPVATAEGGLGFDPLAQRAPARRAARKKSTLPMPALIGGAVVLAAAAVAGLFLIAGGSDKPPEGNSRQVAAKSDGSSTRPTANEESARLGTPMQKDRLDDLQRTDASATEKSGAASADDSVEDDSGKVDKANSPSEQSSVVAPVTNPQVEASVPKLPISDSSPAMDEPSARDGLAADDANQDKPPPADKDALSRIGNEIKEAYADDYARAKSRDQKGSLARKLLAEVGKTTDSETRCGLLDQARQLAAAAGDFELALQAIDELSAGYSVDAVSLKCEALTAAAPAARGAQRTALAGAAMRLADEALDAEDFEQAQSMAKLALSLARGTKDVALVKAATAAAKHVNDVVPVYQNAHQALATLKDNPDDPEADLVAGKFLCLTKWDWPHGLPLLAKSGNAELRALATRELAPPTSADAQAELADAWWELAKHSRGSERFDLEQHAGQWYLKSIGQLSGVRKQTADKRIKELADKFPSEPAQAGSGLIRTTNEFAAKRMQPSTLQPGVCPEAKLPELLEQWAPGFSVKWTGIEVIPEHFGRKNVLRTHPGAEDKPGTFYGRLKVPARMHTRLELTIASDASGDWDLIVMVNDRVIHRSTVDMRSATNGWRDVTIDLTPFAGQTVELQVMNKNTGWFYEWGLWDRIAVITSR